MPGDDWLPDDSVSITKSRFLARTPDRLGLMHRVAAVAAARSEAA